MPELPEVETTKRGITPHIINKTIKKVIIRNHKLRWPVNEKLHELAYSKEITSIERRAKYLILNLDSGTEAIILHLGMSGRLSITCKTEPPQKHDHIDFIFSNDKLLRYHDPRRFGACIWSPQPPLEHKLLKKLGIEPFNEALTAETLYKSSRNKNKAIKSFIMDSNNIVGVGNIYASESLFYARINPAKPCREITESQYKILAQKIKTVLLRAIQQGGTTLRDFLGSDGSLGYFSQELAVYGRNDQPCKNCNTKITQIKMNQRSTFFCASCQS
jgi:formamidopyrimidine-DNA glycosylase